MGTVSYLPRDYDVFIGIDVDKNSFSFTVQDHNMMNRSKKIPSSPEQLYNYIGNNFSNQRVLCAYEAGPTGYNLHDYLSQKDQLCLVLSPFSIPKASNERVKTNRLDSERIVRYLKSGELRPIRVPSEPYRQLRQLIGMRENYSCQSTTAKQRIKSLLLFEHLNEHIDDTRQNWSGMYIDRLKQIPCSGTIRCKLDLLLADLAYCHTQQLRVLKELKALCDKHPDIDRYRGYLQSIPGIGSVIALTILARIGDPEHLANVREIGAFIGVVPKERSTGDTIQRGSVTRLGNNTFRRLIIEASWIAIKYDTELAQFYHRIKARHHPRIASRKAIVAVARKLTQRIYKVLKEQRTYEIR
ncbi:MAG: IS110 family transposase [Candidatus Omnitrophica bacterium]|nr:IS110 family transposase [Candidatus Omnitrophota bacterium]MBU1037594.1 IS110 family transposase [Candidatus Omnitrophota bacterium]